MRTDTRERLRAADLDPSIARALREAELERGRSAWP